ncbi:MAG: mannosyltransferase [Solirubrobacteraceae bacterium]|jgi:hypothetical protein|nr:mannosyltransferase [Solirubrobacteraceae bacterium]
MSSLLNNARVQTPPARAGSLSVPVELITVVLLTAVALALRASQLHQSVGGDEIFTYQDVVGRSLHSVLTTVHTGGENSPPLFFLLAWATAKLGDPSVWIRLPSLLAGTASVPLAYVLGRETVGRTAGLIAALIMAIAPFAVFYGVEARPYALMIFLVSLSTLALLRAVRPGASRWWWVLYALAAAAAAYTHYTCIFVLALQGLWSVWVCRQRIAALMANLAIVILYLPWLPQLRGKSLAVIGDLYPLGAHRVLTDLLRPIGGHPAAPLRAIPTIPGLIALGLCVLAGVVALVIDLRRSPPSGWRARLPQHLPLIIGLTLATPVGLLLYSLLFTDLWLPRGLSASIPAAALLVGALLAALPVRLTALAAAVVAVVLATGTMRSFDAVYSRGPYRAIAARLDRTAGPRSPIYLLSLEGALALPEQAHQPHTFVPNLPTMWKDTPVGGRAYLVLDEALAHLILHTQNGVTHPGNFTLLSSTRYGGALATSLLVYRRTAR